MGQTDRPIRVLHVTAGSDAGGVSRYLFDLCGELVQRGHEVVIAGQRGAWHNLFEDAPWRWVDLPIKGGPLGLWRSVRSLKRFLAQNPVDIVHTHYRRATLVARRIVRSRGLPVLYTLHLSGIAVQGIRGWMTDFGDHTHVAGEQARRWLIETAGVGGDRISVIPHGIASERFPLAGESERIEARRELGLGNQQLVAAFVGRLDEPKNEPWMLDFAQASQEQLPGLQVLIVGEGPHERSLREQIEQKGLSQRVRLVGWRNPLTVYQAADAVLLPSGLEGFSLVCAEAMSVGRAVLRTDTAGATEQIVEGITGRSVAVDRNLFVQAAIEFMLDRAALARMGQAAARHVREHLRFGQQVDQTIALYRQLIGT